MKLETFEKAKELREEIEDVLELQDLLNNLFMYTENSLILQKKGCETINTVTTRQIPEDLRNQILDLIIDYRNKLEHTFLCL